MASTVAGGGRSERWLAMQSDIENTQNVEGSCTQIVWDEDADTWFECISYPASPSRERSLSAGDNPRYYNEQQPHQNNYDGPQGQTQDGEEDYHVASSVDSNDIIESIKFLEYGDFGGRGIASEAGFSDDTYFSREGSASSSSALGSEEDVDLWLNQQYLGDPQAPDAEMEELEGLGPCQYCYCCQENLKGRAWSQRVKEGRKGKKPQEVAAKRSDAGGEDVNNDREGCGSEGREEQVRQWYLAFG